MARKRMIDPEFFLDEDLSKLSPHARLLYIGSWSLADDNVFTLPNRPDWIKAQIFPYESIKIGDLINEIVKIGKFCLFESGGKSYIYIHNMEKHQKIEKPSRQKYPSFNSSSVLLPNQQGSSHSEVKLIEDKISKEKYREYVLLTKEEYDKGCVRFGKINFDGMIERLNDYIGSKGVKYKSHYHTICMWFSRNNQKEVSNEQPRLNPKDF